MGMFDYIRCEMDLPETSVPPPSGDFLTKNTPDQGLTVYTIRKDGSLWWRPYEIVERPLLERPYPLEKDFRALMGVFKMVERDPAPVSFHGDIFFYCGGGKASGWWEYRARFNYGICPRIDLVKFRTPEPPKGED